MAMVTKLQPFSPTVRLNLCHELKEEAREKEEGVQ